MSKHADTVVAAQIISPGVESHQVFTTRFVRCGACNHRLPNLWYAKSDHMLVEAGIIKHLDLVLSRPDGWRWRDDAWRPTNHHLRQRRYAERIAATPGHWQAAE